MNYKYVIKLDKKIYKFIYIKIQLIYHQKILNLYIIHYFIILLVLNNLKPLILNQQILKQQIIKQQIINVIYQIVKIVKIINVLHVKQDLIKMMKEDVNIMVNWVQLKLLQYNYLKK